MNDFSLLALPAHQRFALIDDSRFLRQTNVAIIARYLTPLWIFQDIYSGIFLSGTNLYQFPGDCGLPRSFPAAGNDSVSSRHPIASVNNVINDLRFLSLQELRKAWEECFLWLYNKRSSNKLMRNSHSCVIVTMETSLHVVIYVTWLREGYFSPGSFSAVSCPCNAFWFLELFVLRKFSFTQICMHVSIMH